MLVERIGVHEYKVTFTDYEFTQIVKAAIEDGRTNDSIVKELIELSIQRFFHV